MSTMIHTETDADGVMTVRLDQPDRSTNTLTSEALEELDALLDSLGSDGQEMPRGIIFTSGKPDVFITGADLFAMRAMDRPQLQRFLELGQQVTQRIAELPIPTVAAINGHCLGGGLELALACRSRVAVDDGSVQIGLPEVKLGVLPAWGGTTRMPRLIGLPAALPLLLTGKLLPPRKARSQGLVDEVVRPEALADAARRIVRKQPAKRGPSRLTQMLGGPGFRDLVLNKALKSTRQKTWGHYPAPEKIIDVLRISTRDGVQAGLRAERDAALDLAETEACRNLMRLFFLRHDAKRATKRLNAQPNTVTSTAVVGGGTMGAGIAHALTRAGKPVRLIEVNQDAASAALRRIRKHLDADVRAKRMSSLEAQHAMHRISPATDFTGLKFADLVVEAVAEKLEVKQQVFEKLQRNTRPDAILASNTSSLNVTDLARAVDDPSRVVGLHFFNPVPQMPLVEVVRTDRSSEQALATSLSLGLELGKVPVLVGDGPGFLVNRVLIPYLAEALAMAREGVPITDVDHAMKKWGMPMGPFELLDHVGLDIAVDIFRSVGQRLGDHIAPMPEPFAEQVLDHGWLGKKSGRGFYLHGGGKRRLPFGSSAPRLNTPLLRALTDASTPTHLDEQVIQNRSVLPMANEAARVLDEGIVGSADMIDLATVLGIGLAPFRGGIVRFAESIGLSTLIEQMNELAEQHGERFRPTPALRRVAQQHGSIQDLARTRPGETVSSTAGPSRRAHA